MFGEYFASAIVIIFMLAFTFYGLRILDKNRERLDNPNYKKDKKRKQQTESINAGIERMDTLHTSELEEWDEEFTRPK